MIDEVANIERAEADLDRFIERRALKASGEQRTVEDLGEASAWRYSARLREERLWARLDFHQAQLQAHTRTFERLIRRHTSGLRLVEQELGITHETEGDAA